MALYRREKRQRELESVNLTLTAEKGVLWRNGYRAEERIRLYFEDIGTTIEVPLDELGSFLESDERSSAHSDDVRNFEVAENAGATIVLTYERKFDGHWKKSSTRVTSFPPYCRFIEEIEGDVAGSRFVVAHRPDGAKTRIDVFGDIQCKARSPERLRTLWLGVLAKTHDEDVAALQKFRDRR